MDISGVLYKAVIDGNISAVEDILTRCTPEILEYEGGGVSQYFFVNALFICLLLSMTIRSRLFPATDK